MATVCLAWARQQAGITSLLVGARNAEEVRRNLPSLELTLGEEVLAQLSAATDPVKDRLGDNLDMWRVPSRMR